MNMNNKIVTENGITRRGRFYRWNESGMPILPLIDEIIKLFQANGIPKDLSWESDDEDIKVDVFVGGPRGNPEIKGTLRGVKLGNHYIDAYTLGKPPTLKLQWLDWWTLTPAQLKKVNKLYEFSL